MNVFLTLKNLLCQYLNLINSSAVFCGNNHRIPHSRVLTSSDISLEVPLPFQTDQISPEELEFFRSFDPAYTPKATVQQQEPQINPALSYFSSFRQPEEKTQLNPKLCYLPSLCDQPPYLIQRGSSLIPIPMNFVNTSIETDTEFNLEKTASTSQVNIKQPVPVISGLTVQYREDLHFQSHSFIGNQKNDYHSLHEVRRNGMRVPQELANQRQTDHIVYSEGFLSAWDSDMTRQNQVLNESYYQCESYLESMCREDFKDAYRLPEVFSSLDLAHKNSLRDSDLDANNGPCLSIDRQTKKDLLPSLNPAYVQSLSFTKNLCHSLDTIHIPSYDSGKDMLEKQNELTTPLHHTRNKKTFLTETGNMVQKRRFFGVDYFHVSTPDDEIKEAVYSLPITTIKDKYFHLKKTIFYQLTRARAKINHKTVEEIIQNIKKSSINVKNKILFCILLSFTKKGFKDYYQELPNEIIVDLLDNSPKCESYSKRSLNSALWKWTCYDFTTINEGYHVLIQCFKEFYYDKLAFKSIEYMISFKKHAFYCLRVFFQEEFKGENQ